MSADPSNLSVDFWMPQTWNRYSYALNNPLQMVDQNGLWPTSIHNQIINEAFPGLDSVQIKNLQDASYNTDYKNTVNGLDPQDTAASFVHGMSNGMTLQNPQVAQKLGDDFIAQNEHNAQRLQAEWIASGHTGICPAALTAFGNALHTITDRTSPAHNQPWFGYDDPIGSLAHVIRESNLFDNSREKNAGVGAARTAFSDIFGLDFYYALDGLHEVVTSRILSCADIGGCDD